MGSLKTLTVVGAGALVGLGAWALVHIRNRRNAQMRQRQAQYLKKLRFATVENVGNRRYMEDFNSAKVEEEEGLALFTVCDGHDGQDAAKYVCGNLLGEFLSLKRAGRDLSSALFSSFLAMDGAFELEVAKGNLSHCGTTAVAALVLKDKLLVAGTGDCRAIMSCRGRSRSLNVEHAPSLPAEKMRIEATGGFIDADGYLNGRIAVSRSIGDGHLKNCNGFEALIADPQVFTVNLDGDSEFVVLASDGLWMRPQTVIDLARRSLRIHNSPQLAAEALVEVAVNSPCSSDNVTVMVICFGPDPPQSLAHPRATKNSMLFARGGTSSL